MKASIQAVAAEAGVSISTVSRTFAKPNLVLPETRSKVMAAAEKLDYRISRSAAALKTGQSFRVALLMSDPISTWFNSNTYAGLDSVLHPAGYDISIFEMADAHDRHEFFATLPVRRNVDAVIVNSFNIVPEEVEKTFEHEGTDRRHQHSINQRIQCHGEYRRPSGHACCCEALVLHGPPTYRLCVRDIK